MSFDNMPRSFYEYCLPGIKADKALAKRWTSAELQAEWEQQIEHAYAMGRDDCGYGADAHEESYRWFANRYLRQAYVDGWHEELMT